MSFEDLFVETYGDNATEYLKKEYAVSLNNGRNAFVDYVVETKNGNFAIEENGVHYHHPCFIGNVAYEKQFAYSAHTANGNILEHTTTNRLGYKQYTSNTNMCKLCPNYKGCISTSQNKKTMFRHLWQDYLDEVNEIRHTKIWKDLYPLRSQTIERVFADAKDKHSMRYTQLRGLKKVGWQVLLTFSCMNLKKLAKWLWKKRPKAIAIREILSKIFKKLEKILLKQKLA